MSVISSLLNAIAALKDEVVDIQAEINYVAAAQVKRLSEVESQIADLTKQAKSKAEYIPLDARHTLTGDTLQLVYRETSKWSEERLADLAARYYIPGSELDACKETGHTWALAKRGKG